MRLSADDLKIYTKSMIDLLTDPGIPAFINKTTAQHAVKFTNRTTAQHAVKEIQSVCMIIKLVDTYFNGVLSQGTSRQLHIVRQVSSYFSIERDGAVDSASDFGPWFPGSIPILGIVCCGLEQVTFSQLNVHSVHILSTELTLIVEI